MDKLFEHDFEKNVFYKDCKNLGNNDREAACNYWDSNTEGKGKIKEVRGDIFIVFSEGETEKCKKFKSELNADGFKKITRKECEELGFKINAKNSKNKQVRSACRY
jgi:hypothetical protein